MNLLKQVSTGVIKQNFLILLYGVEGVGKTEFASKSPKAIFLCAEDGSGHLDVTRFPQCTHWLLALKMLEELIEEDHGYKTLVVDTLDWLEKIMHEFLMEQKGVETVAELGTYGTYIGVVNREWMRFIELLTVLKTKMNILLLAHAEIKRFDDPTSNTSYDRYALKLDVRKSAPIFKEFVQNLLFADYETNIKTEKGTGKTKAYGEGTRVVYTQHRPSHDAKNRCSMPYKLPLDFKEVQYYLDLTPTVLLEEIEKLKSTIEDVEKLDLINAKVEENKNDSRMLLQVVERLKELNNE